MNELRRRRADTEQRLRELRQLLGSAAELVKGKACVYATGSYGRGESSQHSDLDLFIVGQTVTNEDHERVSALGELNSTCVKADLIRATRQLGIQEFSGDGKYLVHYSAHGLIDSLGTQRDDAENTFTARLLLLLESCPLLEAAVHENIIKEVIGAYWRDYQDHAESFMPAFLSNDILRLWRTFCVNYEAGTQRAPEDKKAKGKLKNYKLKHSRMLTCYSAILHLLGIYRLKRTVSPEDAFEVARLNPVARLECLLSKDELRDVHPLLKDALARYDEFLATTNVPEGDLIAQFQNGDMAREYMQRAYQFGDLISRALATVGGDDNRYYRLLIV